jgi:hypothetical protein
MLAESVLDWTQEWKQQGLQEGRLDGETSVLERQFWVEHILTHLI